MANGGSLRHQILTAHSHAGFGAYVGRDLVRDPAAKAMDSSTFLSDRDVIFKICVRCDDNTLWKLYLFISPVLVSQVLATSHFWYARTQFHARKLLQPRPTADWRTIYYSVAESTRHPSPARLWTISPAYLAGLHDLNSTLVLFELYGEPNWSRRRDLGKVWRKIRSRDVLFHLMSDGYISPYQQVLQECLEGCSSDGRTDMVIALLDLALEVGGVTLNIERLQRNAVTKGHLNVYQVLSARLSRHRTTAILGDTRALELAIEHGQMDIVRYLFPYRLSQSFVLEHVKRAMRYEQIEAFYFLLEKIEPGTNDRGNARGANDSAMLDLMQCALMCESSEFLAVIFERNEINVSNEQWRDWLFAAIGAGREAVLEYILTQIELNEGDSDLIRVAGQYTSNGNLFPILLADERLDPTCNLVKIVKAMNWKHRVTNIGLLMRDPRVRSEELDSDAAEAICVGLRLKTGEIREMVIAGDDSCSLLLREMLFCGTKGAELKAWIERVMHKLTPPIRALLSYMQYPEVSRATREWELRASGYSETDLALSLCLLDVYFAREPESESDESGEGSGDTDEN